MSTFVVTIFGNEAKAYEAVHALNELHMEGSITLYDTAVAKRQPDGKLAVKERGDGAAASTGIGALLGALIGVFGGPIGVAVGAATGTMIGGTTALVRGDVSDEFLEDVAKKMVPGDVCVLADVSETWTTPIDTRMQALGGFVLREERSDYVDDLMEKRAASFKAGIERRKNEHQSKKAERMHLKVEDKIFDERERLQRFATRARTRLDNTKEELQRKLDALDGQAKTAKPEVKKQIDLRISEIRNDFAAREAKLVHAFELADQALQP